VEWVNQYQVKQVNEMDDRMQRNFTSWGRFLSPASSGAGGFALPTRDRQDQVTGSADYDSPSPAVISGRLTLHKQMLRH
jgi:hypothetical protein